MTYTKHSWREKAGTTGGGGQRETWLNNLETQYDEVVSYYTTTLHDSQFYTHTEMQLKFFSPGMEGSGSGFVAETLDGYTAAQIFGAQVAAGTVVIWYASTGSIPSGWHLCDGRDANTPDLRGKFPVAVGSSYAWKATGGAAKVSPSASAVTVASHTLTEAQLPSHTHAGMVDYRDTQASGAKSYTGASGADSYTTSYTGYTGDGGGHTHTGNSMAGSQGATENNMPAYLAYCYIVKE